MLSMVGAVAFLCLAMNTLPANASILGGDGCNPNRPSDYGQSQSTSYRWDGWEHDLTSGLGGVYSDLWTYSPWVDPAHSGSGDEYVSEWTMLARYHAAPSFAQVGWDERPSSSRHNFYQIYQNGIEQAGLELPSSGVDHFHYYATLFGKYAGSYSFQIDGNDVHDPNTGALVTYAPGYTPQEAFLSGETHNLADQMPGALKSTAAMNDSHVVQNGSTNWYGFGSTPGSAYTVNQDAQGPANDMTNYFGNTVGSSTNFSIWDRYCPVSLSPSVAMTGSGTAFAFWQGQDTALYQAQGPGSGSLSGPYYRGYAPLGSAPAVAVDGNGYTYAYWKGTDGNLWEAYWNGSAWVGPYNRGMGTLGSTPSVAMTAGGYVYVFWTGTDGALYQAQGAGNGSLSGPYYRGYTSLGSAPTAAVDGPYAVKLGTTGW
jgi:hypothetical protein